MPYGNAKPHRDTSWEENELNLALALSRSVIAQLSKRVDVENPATATHAHLEDVEEIPRDFGRRRNFRSLKVQSLMLSVPQTTYNIAETPPRYSSLYGKEDPPQPFAYHTPRTAAAARSPRVEPSAPIFPHNSAGKWISVHHGPQPVNQFVFQTPAPTIKLFHAPSKVVRREKSSSCKACYCFMIVIILIIASILAVNFAVRYFILPYWRDHHDHDEHHPDRRHKPPTAWSPPVGPETSPSYTTGPTTNPTVTSYSVGNATALTLLEFLLN